jgi:hypothetical protein
MYQPQPRAKTPKHLRTSAAGLWLSAPLRAPKSPDMFPGFDCELSKSHSMALGSRLT